MQGNITHKNLTNRKVMTVEKRFPTSTPIDTTEADIATPHEVLASPPKEVADAMHPVSKRDEFSALEKARKMEADAKDKLKKAEALSEAYQSGDLEKIAKASGMSVSDYVRWINNKAINAPTTAELSPSEQIAKHDKEYREYTDQQIKELKEFRSSYSKESYINKNILPHIIKNPDTYEFICDKGEDVVCGLLYDYMNQHFNETGGPGKGEELDPVVLLDDLENQYELEWKERQDKIKTFKKFQSQATPTVKTSIGSAKTMPAAKGQDAASLQGRTNDLPEGLEDEVVDAEDSLAQSAPSNLGSTPSRGASSIDKAARKASGFPTGGTTPKGHPLSREARLARLK